MAVTIREKPLVLKPDMTVDQRDATRPDFYQALDADFGGFAGHALISEYSFDSDWGMWEVHPNGDETIILLSGAADFLFQQEGEVQVVSLQEPGQYVVIPKGAWHTARTDTPTKALFVTPGEGTEHAAEPPTS